MNILVVGNGFDLAHDLKTSYPDFLDFMQEYIGDASKQIFDEKGNALKELDAEMRNLIKDENLLLSYFLDIYKARCEVGKRGWIDFEQEMACIVKAFDVMLNYKQGMFVLRQNEDIGDYISKDVMKAYFGSKSQGGILMRGDFSVAQILEKGEKLHNDLMKVTRMLEIYLIVNANMRSISKRIPVIQNHNFYRILSFNYTNTYERLYGMGTEKYCYIHGKARPDSDVEKSNLVLGIDEYLDSSRKDDDNTFVTFKKFYQRIYKDGDSSYIDWLKEIPLNGGNYTPLDIFYFGHSLDVTDKDILKSLIMHDRAHNHFYYHNSISMGKQIKNLIRIIGEDSLIEKTRGINKSIEFIPIN